MSCSIFKRKTVQSLRLQALHGFYSLHKAREKRYIEGDKSRRLQMNTKQTLTKKWLVVIVIVLMLALTLKDVDANQLESFTIKDMLPLFVITAVIFILKTSVLSMLLLAIRKLWHKLSKNRISK